MALGIIVLVDFFVDIPYLNILGQVLVDWAVILAGVALILGVVNLLLVHFRKVRMRRPGWPYSIVLLVSLWIVLVLGLLDPAGPQSENVLWIFHTIQVPLQSAFFALMAFFMLTATYRAFRVRRLESLLFIGSGLVVLLGTTAAGTSLWEGFGTIRAWILSVPAMAGARGILIGVALASVIMGLRLLLGIDRPYAE